MQARKVIWKNFKNMLTKSVLVYYANSTLTQYNNLINNNNEAAMIRRCSMDIIFDEKSPIYVQIMNMIKKQIISKELREGDKLASVRDLSTELKVNPNTIQRAYKELEREGLAYTQRGMGTFVTEDKNIIYNLKKDTAKEVMDSFIEGMKHLGFSSEEIVDMVSKILKEEEK